MSGPRRRTFVGPIVSRVTWHGGRGRQRSRWALIIALVGPERDEGLHRLVGIRELHGAQRAGAGHDRLDALAHVFELRGSEASAVALGDHGEEAIDFVRSETRFFHV